MTTEAQKRATEKYQNEHITRVVVKLNDNTDKDLIERYDTLKSLKMNVSGELKKAWREYLERQ